MKWWPKRQIGGIGRSDVTDSGSAFPSRSRRSLEQIDEVLPGDPEVVGGGLGGESLFLWEHDDGPALVHHLEDAEKLLENGFREIVSLAGFNRVTDLVATPGRFT